VIDEPDLRTGFVAPELEAEFPELRLAWVHHEATTGRSPLDVRERLEDASNRFTGGKAVNMRQQPIPSAYRVFFRHLGIDPDEQRTPIEALAVERLRAGGFKSAGLLDDALLLATLETGVPVQAFDAAAVEGEPGLRLAARGEELGTHAPIAPGRVVIADAQRPLAVLFGDVAPHAAPGRHTSRVVLAAISVKGVPEVSVQEAIWTAVDTLSAAPG
jgi:DNA/RNA-binding domain of Phe-tRNA-synthetase-like protein